MKDESNDGTAPPGDTGPGLQSPAVHSSTESSDACQEKSRARSGAGSDASGTHFVPTNEIVRNLTRRYGPTAANESEFDSKRG